MTARQFAILVLTVLGLVVGGCIAVPFVLAWQAGAHHQMEQSN